MDLKRFFIILCSLGLSLSSSMISSQINDNFWQEAKNLDGKVKIVSSQPDIEIFSSPNSIILKINKETEVRIYTILGKLISSEKLTPGLFKCHLEPHGIYIIKTNENSWKLAI